MSIQALPVEKKKTKNVSFCIYVRQWGRSNAVLLGQCCILLWPNWGWRKPFAFLSAWLCLISVNTRIFSNFLMQSDVCSFGGSQHPCTGAPYVSSVCLVFSFKRSCQSYIFPPEKRFITVKSPVGGCLKFSVASS